MQSSILWAGDGLTLGLQGWYLFLVPQGLHSTSIQTPLSPRVPRSMGYIHLTDSDLLASLGGVQGWVAVLLPKVLTGDWLPWEKHFQSEAFPTFFSAFASVTLWHWSKSLLQCNTRHLKVLWVSFLYITHVF